MLYIITALYEEAAPFIRYYALKKDIACTHFESFSSDRAKLLITKPGAVRAAAVVSSFFTLYPPSATDLMLCIGVSGCADPHIPIGTMYRINRIFDKASGRSVYPEMIFSLPFSEAGLTTVPQVMDNSSAFRENDICLYDMESYGVYTAASLFLKTHQMVFLRAVSDHITDLPAASFSELRVRVTACIENNLPVLIPDLNALCELIPNTFELSTEEAALYEQTCQALHLSVTSSGRLKQLMRYLHLNSAPYLEQFTSIITVPLQKGCRSKKEGLQYLEKLFEQLL